MADSIHGHNSDTTTSLEKLIDFFLDFYKECERPFNDPPQRKRRKLNDDNILSGRYQAPTAYLLAAVIYNVANSSIQKRQSDSDN